jgi:hypothetical protein
MVFVGLIVVGYAYVWRKGGLEIATRRPAAQEEARP